MATSTSTRERARATPLFNYFASAVDSTLPRWRHLSKDLLLIHGDGASVPAAHLSATPRPSVPRDN